MIGQTIQCEAPPSQAAIAKAVETAKEFAVHCDLAPLYRDRLCVIMEELVSNVVRHGQVPLDSVVSFALEARPNAILIRLSDAGVAFDPRQPLEAAEQPAEEGGWGWPIILAWTQVLSYVREDGVNRLDLAMPASYQDHS